MGNQKTPTDAAQASRPDAHTPGQPHAGAEHVPPARIRLAPAYRTAQRDAGAVPALTLAHAHASPVAFLVTETDRTETARPLYVRNMTASHGPDGQLRHLDLSLSTHAPTPRDYAQASNTQLNAWAGGPLKDHKALAELAVREGKVREMEARAYALGGRAPLTTEDARSQADALAAELAASQAEEPTAQDPDTMSAERVAVERLKIDLEHAQRQAAVTHAMLTTFEATVTRLEYAAGGLVMLTLDAGAEPGPVAALYFRALRHGDPVTLRGLEGVTVKASLLGHALKTGRELRVSIQGQDAAQRRRVAEWLDGARTRQPGHTRMETEPVGFRVIVEALK